MTRAYRNNNPGNIEYGPFAKSQGGVLEIVETGKPRFAKFETAARGVMALAKLLSGPLYVNLAIQDAIARYAPSSENHTQLYTDFVCEDSNLSPLTKIAELNAFEFLSFMRSIARFEGYQN